MDKKRTLFMVENQNILNFQGLYGDEYSNYTSEYIFLELISTRSKTFDWNIKPHIHTNLYQIFIVQKGSLVFKDTINTTSITGPTIILIPPSKLHGLVYSPEVEGQILTLSESIVEDIFQTSSLIWNTLDEIRILTDFEEIPTFEIFQNILENISTELFEENPERNVMLKAFLVQFFINLHRINKQEEAQKGGTMVLLHFRKFQQNIKYSIYPKSIPEFAEELGITSVHLNRICNAVAGKSAIELVHQNIISEAQKYLLHTSYSISEIAYLLKFEYPNYFAKLFKKHVGLSPLEFRRKDRK